jgi:hypothetical protein
VQALNDALAIPRTLDALRGDDIPELARAACHEADLNYPVPRRMSPADCEMLLGSVLAGAPQAAAKKAPARRRRPAAAKTSRKVRPKA